jgi:hypothetical protein
MLRVYLATTEALYARGEEWTAFEARDARLIE